MVAKVGGGAFGLCIFAIIAFAIYGGLWQPVAAGNVCVGEHVPLTLRPDAMPFLNIRIGPKHGWFLLDTGTDISIIDFRAYEQPRPEGFIRLLGSSLPTIESAWFLPKDLSRDKGPKDEPVLGVIGSDILGSRTVELHLDAQDPYLTISNERCPSSFFKERGLRAIDQGGYFASHWWYPYIARWSDPNNLVAFVRLGGIEAPAMIDTGFDGLIRALDINEPFLRRLRRQRVTIKSAGSATFRGCTGEAQAGSIWDVVDTPLSITTETGELIRAFGPPPLLMKPANLHACGWGIGNAEKPWAQIGMHQLLALGVVVIDGPNNKVWLPQKRGSTSTVPPFLAVPPFSAVSLAWNAKGAWQIVRRRTENEADAEALKGCNRRSNAQNDCQIAASIKTAGFGCLALAWDKKNLKLQTSVLDAFGAAREGAIRGCKQSPDAQCRVVNTTCND
jgi:hypothetical protein